MAHQNDFNCLTHPAIGRRDSVATALVALCLLFLGGCASQQSTPPQPSSASPLPAIEWPAPSPTQTPTETPSTATIPAPMRGLTVDSVENLPALVEAVDALDYKPTLRIVFDPELGPADYAPAIEALKPHAYLMGQLLDSTALSEHAVAEVEGRAQTLVSAFAPQVDLWEVGNEVNGEWVGGSPEEILTKVNTANRVIKAAGESTAITFNYWSGPDCYSQPWETTPVFLQSVPPDLRNQVDVVMLSMYETACEPPQHPEATDLAQELSLLGQHFPEAKLAMGEIGAQGVEDNLPADPTLAEKDRIARRYVSMQPALEQALGDRFIGGWFWWYFVDDAVPKDKPESLWPTLNELLND